MWQLIVIGFTTHVCPKLYLKKNVNGSDLVAYAVVMCIFWAYRHSSIYAVNVGTQKKYAESENGVNQGKDSYRDGRNTHTDFLKIRN